MLFILCFLLAICTCAAPMVYVFQNGIPIIFINKMFHCGKFERKNLLNVDKKKRSMIK